MTANTAKTAKTPGDQESKHLPRVGFIGLGNMGGPMAANLVQAGYSVTGFDLVPEALELGTKVARVSQGRFAPPWRRKMRCRAKFSDRPIALWRGVEDT